MRPTRAAASRAIKRVRAVSESSDSVVVISDSDDAFDPSPASASASASEGGVASPVVITESESEEEQQGRKRKRVAGIKKEAVVLDIEDCVPRPHGRDYHSIGDIAQNQDKLLQWFESVRRMPWRKTYDPAVSPDEKAQRAYEVWVSEVMLQQTQVSTVIDYWTRWIDKWPTISDLAKADIEEVNAAWRGLGYYRRARSLLEGAKVAGKQFGGRLPSDPDELEKGIPGVGRYTAGAICSIAYGVRTPIVDGNIHRVLSRLLAVHATQTAPGTIKFLWETAEALVDKLPRGLGRGIAGDWNQALMELGATVCRPVNPQCGACPLNEACKAFKELDTPPPPSSPECTLCEPIPAAKNTKHIPSVTVFPMRKVKKASREENEVVVITEWRGSGGERKWLFTKRPEKGLLAGLFEPPTMPVSLKNDHLSTGLEGVISLIGPLTPTSHKAIIPVQHIFSHINMTYHAQHLVFATDTNEPPAPAAGFWLDKDAVEHANVGTGVKKVWAAVFGKWGSFEVDTKGTGKVRAKAKVGAKAGTKAAVGKVKSVKVKSEVGTTRVRRVAMPLMPKVE